MNSPTIANAAENLSCIQCNSTIQNPPLYWIQNSKPVMVNGVWKCLFKADEDWPLCNVYCSFEHEKSKSPTQQKEQKNDRIRRK